MRSPNRPFAVYSSEIHPSFSIVFAAPLPLALCLLLGKRGFTGLPGGEWWGERHGQKWTWPSRFALHGGAQLAIALVSPTRGDGSAPGSANINGTSCPGPGRSPCVPCVFLFCLSHTQCLPFSSWFSSVFSFLCFLVLF